MVWPPDFVKVDHAGLGTRGNLSLLPSLSHGNFRCFVARHERRTKSLFRLANFVCDLSHPLVIKYGPSLLTLSSRFAISVV